jgi:riboflavin kinase/FMN adenylyltransferase
LRADEHDAIRGDDPRHPAVANIGFRPTVSALSGTAAESARVEVHLIDFDGDLYGESIELEFTALLRSERKFPDLAALKTQIGADVEEARRVLARASA